jgi:[FeFe] hydrogenase H-cluster maturation GTPase HydF
MGGQTADETSPCRRQKELLMPKSDKPFIGIFGRRNAGKSSFVNALCGREVSIVSDVPGTTTDPVNKNVEIPGIGPVVFVDTAGLDDVGEVGALRVQAAKKALEKVDLGIVIFFDNTFGQSEDDIVSLLLDRNTPFFAVHNKCDLVSLDTTVRSALQERLGTDVCDFSAKEKTNFEAVRDLIRVHLPASAYNRPSILGDLVGHGDTVLLITPIDIEAPEGRIILPQVQTIRDILDNDCTVLMMKEREVDGFFRKYPNVKPALAVTDSQVFLKAAAQVPREVPLTSFSILFARLKGDFLTFVNGTRAIKTLRDNDPVLILESCAHHVSGDDIGRVKIPRWLADRTGKALVFDVAAGFDAPKRPLEEYKLVIQCGGCMLTRKQLINRIRPAVERGIPVSNYGMTIAWCHGIFDRAIAPFFKSDSAEDYL